MILKDIASDLNIDISTVSRVTNGKYVQLPWEIKELKTFFSESIQTESGKAVSNTETSQAICLGKCSYDANILKLSQQLDTVCVRKFCVCLINRYQIGSRCRNSCQLCGRIGRASRIIWTSNKLDATPCSDKFVYGKFKVRLQRYCRYTSPLYVRKDRI